MTTKTATMIERMATVVSDAIERLKRAFDARISATEEALDKLREEVTATGVRREHELSTELLARLEALEVRIAAVPDAKQLAASAAHLVDVPVVPDVSGLVKEAAERIASMVAENAASVDARFEALGAALDVQTIAAAASRLIDVPAAPDLSELVNETRALELIAEATARLQPLLDLAELTRSLVAQLPTAEALAQQAAALIPVPKDGASFTLEQARPIMLELAQNVIPTAEDVAGIIGRSYINAWALDFERRAQDLLQRAVDRMPVPKDGVDGMGFDDLVVEYDGERTFTVALVRGERRKAHSFKLPMMLYRKVYAEKVSYERGDVVTWGGSSWVALKDAPQGKPGDASRDWQLIVKKGRDGSSA